MLTSPVILVHNQANRKLQCQAVLEVQGKKKNQYLPNEKKKKSMGKPLYFQISIQEDITMKREGKKLKL